MKQFLVEVFTTRANGGKIAAAERRAMLAARHLSRADREVHFVRATYIPEDELCFFMFDADSGREAALAARRAGLEPIRVVEVAPNSKEER